QVTVQSRNASGGPENVIADAVVSLTTTSPPTKAGFYSDDACTVPITTVTLLTGTKTAPFYWKDTQAGSPALTAATPGMLSVTATQTVTAAAASRLDFSTLEQAVPAGACSGITSVVTADPYDNPSNVTASTQVNLTSDSPSGLFFSDPS